MIGQLVIGALRLPTDVRVDKRVPKKLLSQHFGSRSSDKKVIQEGLHDLVWIAALKPNNIGIPAWRDEAREYSEIHILLAHLRPQGKVIRLLELIHKAIPYPVFLVAVQEETSTVSLAHKRRSQTDGSQVVIETIESTRPFRPQTPTTEEALFLDSLSIAAQPSRDLFATYEGWIERVIALAAAHVSGRFSVVESPELSARRRAALQEHLRLERELAGLRASAVKEKQLNKRVELNLEIRRLEALIAQVTMNL